MFNLPVKTWQNYGPHALPPVNSANTSRQVGRLDSEKNAAIRLSGDNILEEHCYFDNAEGKVFIYSMPDSATVRAICHSIHHSHYSNSS